MFEHRLKLAGRITDIRPAYEQKISSWGPSTLEGIVTVKKPLRQTYKAMEEEMQTRSESAYRSGFEDGKKMGISEAGESMSTLLRQLENAARDLITEKGKVLQSSQEMIVQLSGMIAEKILCHEITIDQTKIQTMVCEAVKAVDITGSVTLRVNPGDWKLIKDVENDIRSASHEFERLDIVEDSSVQPGGCILSGSTGIFDAQLTTQLDEITRRLMESA